FIMAAAFMSCGLSLGVGSSGSSANVTSLAITPPNINIAVNANMQFHATGSMSNGTTNDVTTQVTWSSSSSAIATVNGNGVVTGVGSGTVTIFATASGGIMGSSTVTVTVPITSTFSVGTNPMSIAIDS